MEDCIGFPDWSPGKVLAYRLAAAGEQGLFLNAAHVEELTAELDEVLAAIRQADADVPEPKGLFEYAPGSVTIGLEPHVAERIEAPIWNSYEQWPPMPLGGVEIDQLASELGLRAVNGLSLDVPEGPTYAVTLCLDELVNTPAASEAFDALPGVIYAEPNYRIGDGPDTAVEKLRDDWHVVIRDAKGDCPAGCIEQRLYFFVVTPDSARQLPEAEAAREPILKGLAETWSR